MRKLRRVIENPYRIFSVLAARGWFANMSDERYLRLMYRSQMGKRLDLERPKTFNEKLQWLKLYDHRPEYTALVDKYAVREHIARTIGEEYLVPLVGGPWDSFEEIDFDALPEDFVLKCTHDSGGVVICGCKASLDMEKTRQKIEKSLKRNFYLFSREWPYKHIKPRIIAEKRLVDESGTELKDYKVMCFGGVPKLIQVHRGRFAQHTQDFFDTQWNRLNICQGIPCSDVPVDKPERLEEMLSLSAVLSKDYPQLRVDWYYVAGRLYFGELTFFDGSGMAGFEPEEWDEKLGSWITLPEKTMEKQTGI